MRVLFVESSVGGVGGSLHSLWTLVSHLERKKVQAELLVFQEISFWQKFRDSGIHVEVWADAGEKYGRPAPAEIPRQGKENASQADPVPHGYTVPDVAVRLAQPAWRRAAAGLGRLIIQDLPLAYRLNNMVRRRGIQILHANDRLGSNRFVALAGCMSCCPVIQHERLVSPYGWADVWLSGWLSETLCVSEQVADSVREMGHRGRSIEVVPNAVEFTSVPSRETSPVRPRVGVLGRLVAWKGQDLFLEAMSLLGEHPACPEFMIIGAPSPGSEAYAEGLKETARGMPIAERVEFTGYIANPMDLLAGLSVLVVSSRTPEPFGRTVIEAMSQGVPVVVPSVGGPSEIVEDGVTGLLYPPNSPAHLAAAVRRLLDNPGLAENIGRRGQEKARDKYQASGHARVVEGVYDRVLAGRN